MQKIPVRHILEEIGLTRNESIVYLELLKAGTSLAKNLTRITNMHRTSVYSCLHRLHKKGLVAISSFDGKTYFEAVDPDKLMALLKEREHQLKSILPDLKKLKESKFYTPHEVQYFKGKQGLKTIFEDILKTGEDYVGWGPEEKIEHLLKYYFIHYIEARRKKKIHAKMIYSSESKGKAYTKSPLLNIKYFTEPFDSPTAHRVYGDNVAILLLEDEPLCILIKNKIIANSYRKHFDMIWKNTEKK